jgi:pimeloyl-ACP methyl ester carboxylesterase
VVCPTLVIQGELDGHATQQHARDIAASVRQGTLWLIPAVHHMPPDEIPHVFNRRLLSFLEPALLALGLSAVG